MDIKRPSYHSMIQQSARDRVRIRYATLASPWKDSCLWTFFKDLIEALLACTIKPLLLPMKENAKNVGHGGWLITSASPNYRFTQTFADSSSSARKVVRKKRCRICLITSPCGSELERLNILLRSNSATCALQKPKQINITLPIPLATLF